MQYFLRQVSVRLHYHTICKTDNHARRWALHTSVCSCAITTFAAQWRLMRPWCPGGSPYGSSQSDADRTAATSVLMRSNLALMSDSKQWATQQSDRHTVWRYICVSVKWCRQCSFVQYLAEVWACWGEPVVLWALYTAPRPTFSEAKIVT